MLAQDYIPYPEENQFIGYISANYLDLFPEILTQSQFNRRAHNLRLLVGRMRRYWLRNMGYMSKTDLLLDTKPVPVVGYKLVMVCTLEAIPAEFDRWLNSIRERVEGLFQEIQNTGRNIEPLLAKTVTGLATRIISKMTSHLLKFILRKVHGIDVQTFTQTI
jgi:hypothetical protein